MRRRRAGEAGEGRRRKRSLLPSCLAVGCGVPILGLLILWFVFSINNRPPSIVVPTPPPLPNNAYNDFVRAAQMAKIIQHKSPASMPNPPTDDAGLLKVTAACAKDAAPALAVMRQALSKPCQAPPKRSMFGYTSNYGALRELARTLSGVIQYYELSGQPGKAMETMLDGEEMAVMLPNGGGIMDSLSAVALEDIALYPFEKNLPRLSPAELAHIADRLERITRKRPLYADVLLEEGNVTTASWLETLRDPKMQGLKARYELMHNLMLTPEEGRSQWKEHWEALNYTLASKSAMLKETQDYYRALVKEARSPYSGSSKIAVPANPLAQLSEVFDTARTIFLYRQAVLELLRVETALYRYKAATGHYPGTLSQLVPTYLKAVPDDPFGGAIDKPFHYTARDGGKAFLLYSLGSDLADNAGLPAYAAAQTPGDIVAGHLVRPRKKP